MKYRVYNTNDTPNNGSLNYYDTKSEKDAVRMCFLLNNSYNADFQGLVWVFSEVKR